MSPSSEVDAGVVELWEVRLDVSDDATASYAADLSTDEARAVSRFIGERARRQYIISRAGARRILSTYVGLEPRAIGFKVGPYGKPALAAPNEQGIEFNTSHSGSLALIAVARARQVGVDMEHVRPITKALQVAKRFFSDAEYEMLRDLPDDQRDRAFLSVWVAREGTAKAQGLSVWRGLAKLETPEGWTAVVVDLGPEYVVAVVAAGDDWRVVRRGMLKV